MPHRGESKLRGKHHCATSIRKEHFGATIRACELQEGKNSNQFEIIGTKGRLVFHTNSYAPATGHNRFDFIDTHNRNRSFIVKSEINAYTNQILMPKHDAIMQLETAASPTSSLLDSMSMMELLTDWENEAVHNAESPIGTAAMLKSRSLLI